MQDNPELIKNMIFLIDYLQKNINAEEVPVASMVLNANNEVVAFGLNKREVNKNPLHHSELVCINAVSEKLKTRRLNNLTIYITLEPCAMCAGAIVNAGISKIVFGAFENNTGALGSKFDLVRELNLKQIEVIGGILEKENKKILKEFFKTKRGID